MTAAAAGAGAAGAAVPGSARIGRPELVLLLVILALAALTRLPGLADRGRWDADQGHDMLVLHGLVTDGTVPLLGPRTSIGTFHHGAVYYYLLAPAAYLSGADPVAVTAEIALFGIAAVAGAWWLARLLGGPIGAAAAGLLAAVSPAGIDESTFIWNPNLIPAAAALAFAGAVMARRTGQARWWVASGVGAMVTMQCHVLGVVIMAPLAWAWAADLVRRRRRHQTRAVALGGLGAMLVIGAGFLPLLAYELSHGFPETSGMLDYVVSGGRSTAGADVLERIALVGLRSITWPFAGLITDRPSLSLVVAAVVAVLGTVAMLGRRWPNPAGLGATDQTSDASSARWLAAALGVSVVLLAIFAPSLAVIVPELPNDHYHAFLDPIVIALVGVGLGRLWSAGTAAGAMDLATGDGRAAEGSGPARADRSWVRPARLVALVLVLVLAGIAVTSWPPPVAPDGGWPLTDEASVRVLASTGDAPVSLAGIPPFKSADALRFPLQRRGATVLPGDPAAAVDPSAAPWLVIVCDPLFDEVVGDACGGAAEDAWLGDLEADGLRLVDRFEAGPRRTITVYATR